MAISRERFNEGSSGYISAQIVDRYGAPVSVDDLTAATLTLLDLQTYAPGASPTVGIINARDDQDILASGLSPAELNDVSYESNGYFRWDVQPEDNVIVTPRRQLERHRAEFHFEFAGGAFNYPIEIEVVNLRKAL